MIVVKDRSDLEHCCSHHNQETKDKIEELETLVMKLNETRIDFISGSRDRLDSNGSLVIKVILNDVRIIVRDILTILDKLTPYNCELLESLHAIILEFKESIPSNPCNGAMGCCTEENPCDVNEGSCGPNNPNTCKEGLFCDNDRYVSRYYVPTGTHHIISLRGMYLFHSI